MRPIFVDELAMERGRELRREASLARRARRAGRPSGAWSIREAVGLGLVRTGFRLMKGVA